ncbi:hypothetical protein [Microterricola pindariensis]|nr:hypothetical protein [Microterricola pindariensis]
MILLMIALALLAAWAVIAAVVTAARDGYRAVPDRHPELRVAR